MKTYAHHHADTPHGPSSAPPIPVSVLMTFLFVGAQWVVYVLGVIPMRWPSIYHGVTAFSVTSMVVAVLLLGFLSVDYRRNRIEAHGRRRFQMIVFALAGVLLALFMIFMFRVMQYGGPVA